MLVSSSFPIKPQMARRRIPPAVEEMILVLCRRRCCVCYGLNRDISIKKGQIAHLDRDPGNNVPDNLAFLCMDHHDEYDTRTSQSKGLIPRELRRFRKELDEVIDRVWKEPVVVGATEVRAPGDISGHYIREGEYESAELEVRVLPSTRVHVTGLALWDRKREYGPNIGELDFEALLEQGKVVFRDRTAAGDDYRLELMFEDGRAVAREQYVIGYFGMNVSFEGEYQRLEHAA